MNKGYTGTSIADIAQKANISKGLMYNYFKSKDDLVREIILVGIEKLMKDIPVDFSKELDRESMIQMIEIYFDLIERNPAYWRLYIAVISQPAVTELVKDEVFQMLQQFIRAVSQYYIKKGVKNPEAYGLLLGAIFDGIGLDYLFAPENYPINEIKELVIEKFT